MSEWLDFFYNFHFIGKCDLKQGRLTPQSLTPPCKPQLLWQSEQDQQDWQH